MNIQVGTQHITPSDGNVFVDLGIAPVAAHTLKIKSDLMILLTEWIKENQLKQNDAAELLHVSSSRVADLMRGKIDTFSIDTLIEMLELTGAHVDLTVAVRPMPVSAKQSAQAHAT